MDADLLRQRRNLIAISAVLLIFDFADVKVSKVSVLGTELLIGDVRVLMWSAWVMWFYFFIRYYQYWRTAEGQAVRKEFSNASYRRAQRALKRKRAREHKQISFRELNGRTHWRYSEPKKDSKPGHVTTEITQEIPVSLFYKLWWKVRAVVDVSLHTTSVTDLILPFVLAIAAPVVTIYSHWPIVSAWILETVSTSL